MIAYIQEQKSAELCCGCSACEAVCPVDAIALETDAEGFSYPRIDTDKCIQCGKCSRVCPMEGNTEKKEAEKAYAAVNRDEKTLSESSSGGVFSAMAELMLEAGGVVFGSVLENNRVVCKMADNKNDLAPMRGSKYVQSDMRGAIKQVNRCIREGRLLLFTGTPCQCAAVRKMAGDNNDRVITLDFVCHGVPSPGVFSDYIKFLEKKHKSDIQFRSFRIKNSQRIGIYESYFSGGRIFKNPVYTSPFLTAFFNNLLFRPSCYSCPYAQEKRASDLTMCDFWGCEKVLPELDVLKGVSGFLVNSERGAEWAEKLREKMTLIPVKVSDISADNTNLRMPSPKPSYREAFFADRETMDFEKLSRKYMKDPKAPLKFMAGMLPKKIRKKLKAILKIT